MGQGIALRADSRACRTIVAADSREQKLHQQGLASGGDVILQSRTSGACDTRLILARQSVSPGSANAPPRTAKISCSDRAVSDLADRRIESVVKPRRIRGPNRRGLGPGLGLASRARTAKARQ